jgi:serine/threonine-protein phosphatase PPG1
MLDRRVEPAPESPQSDLLWDDPDGDVETWASSTRGTGCRFGWRPLEQFLQQNRLVTVLRAHQVCSHGYQPFWCGQLYTIWGAPGYKYTGDQKAAVALIDDGGTTIEFRQYEKVLERREPMRDLGVPLYFV